MPGLQIINAEYIIIHDIIISMSFLCHLQMLTEILIKDKVFKDIKNFKILPEFQ